MSQTARHLLGVVPLDEPQTQEKRVTVEGPGETSFVQISYHAPCASDQDFFALTVLDSLLTGPSSLNMFGSGGTTNKTSRLYRALVEGEIFRFRPRHPAGDPRPLSLLHQPDRATPNHTPDEVLAAVDDEVKKVLDSPVTQEEISRAIKQAPKPCSHTAARISPTRPFGWATQRCSPGYDWFENYIGHLSRVTPGRCPANSPVISDP